MWSLLINWRSYRKFRIRHAVVDESTGEQAGNIIQQKDIRPDQNLFSVAPNFLIKIVVCIERCYAAARSRR